MYLFRNHINNVTALSNKKINYNYNKYFLIYYYYYIILLGGVKSNLLVYQNALL